MFRYYLIISSILLFFLFPRNIFAESSYVLPYPSAMPGSIFYKLNLIQEEILKFWYFGDFGQFKYNLSQSDKYFVEAKTLFDYKQHFLAFQALQKSDKYFRKVKPAIFSAKRNGKNTTDKEKLLKEAAEKQEKIFRKNPFDPGLKTHKLTGKLKAFWAFSIDHKYRIIFEFAKTNEVWFLSVGSHQIYR